MNKTNVTIAIPPALVGDGAVVGPVVDLQGTEKHFLAVTVGAYTDGDITVLLEDGDDSGLSDAAAVTAADQVRGNLYNVAITPSAANRVYKFELLSKFKRYARATVTGANITGTSLGLSASFVERRLDSTDSNDSNVA